jgi:hypothetical protein
VFVDGGPAQAGDLRHLGSRGSRVGLAARGHLAAGVTSCPWWRGALRAPRGGTGGGSKAHGTRCRDLGPAGLGHPGRDGRAAHGGGRGIVAVARADRGPGWRQRGQLGEVVESRGGMGRAHAKGRQEVAPCLPVRRIGVALPSVLSDCSPKKSLEQGIKGSLSAFCQVEP